MFIAEKSLDGSGVGELTTLDMARHANNPTRRSISFSPPPVLS